MSNTAEIKDALELAMARIGCPPGDNADADIYHRLSRAIALLADMEMEGRRYQAWTEIEECSPPDKTEVLLAGYAYNEKRRGYWYRVGYYEGGMYFDNDDIDPWTGWPPVFWTHLPSAPNVA
jgi:hypothetical protein